MSDAKKVYYGSYSHVYDADDDIPGETGEKKCALWTDGQLHVEESATDDNHVVRKGDLTDAIGTLVTEQMAAAIAAAIDAEDIDGAIETAVSEATVLEVVIDGDDTILRTPTLSAVNVWDVRGAELRDVNKIVPDSAWLDIVTVEGSLEATADIIAQSVLPTVSVRAPSIIADGAVTVVGTGSDNSGYIQANPTAGEVPQHMYFESVSGDFRFNSEAQLDDGALYAASFNVVPSSAESKKDIATIDEKKAWDDLDTRRAVTYKLKKSTKDETLMGFIAEEEEGPGAKGINLINSIARNTAALKEAKRRITILEEQVKGLMEIVQKLVETNQ